jgi:hypothetical protein
VSSYVVRIRTTSLEVTEELRKLNNEELNDLYCSPNIVRTIKSRRIFGTKWEEVTGEWRKLHNEELNYLYCSPNTVRMIKSRRMK